MVSHKRITVPFTSLPTGTPSPPLQSFINPYGPQFPPLRSKVPSFTVRTRLCAGPSLGLVLSPYVIFPPHPPYVILPTAQLPIVLPSLFPYNTLCLLPSNQHHFPLLCPFPPKRQSNRIMCHQRTNCELLGPIYITTMHHHHIIIIIINH